MAKVDSINGKSVKDIMEKLRAKGERAIMAAKSALREGAADIVRDAKSRCPVKTGALQESIHEIEENGGISFKIVADAENAEGVQYGKFVEYGLRSQPFLYPAIDQNIIPLNQKIKSALKGEMKK